MLTIDYFDAIINDLNEKKAPRDHVFLLDDDTMQEISSFWNSLASSGIRNNLCGEVSVDMVQYGGYRLHFAKKSEADKMITIVIKQKNI